MEHGCQTEHFDKKFVNCRIEWKIENFCFAIRSGSFDIYSPEFRLKGTHLTKWRMILEINLGKSKEGCITFFLERLSDSGPDTVLVNWEVAVIAGKKLYVPIQYSSGFEKNLKKAVNLPSITDVLGHLLPFESDTLTIGCHLIVCSQDQSASLAKPITPGLRCLSEDLKILFKQTKYQDITVKIGEKEIKAHKAILSRNKIFKYLIGRAENNVIEFKNCDFESLSKLISFMYSGNMEIILGNPSISMYQCIEYFKCEILLCYYAPEQLNMNTKIDVEEHKLHWAISEFSKKTEDCISSPLFKGINAKRAWRLHLYPIAKDGSEYISVFAELVEENKPKYLCLEFAVEDSNGQIYFPNRILRFNNCYDNMGFRRFVRKDSLEVSSLLLQDTLNLVFKVRTSVGEQKCSLGTRRMSVITFSKEPSYTALSSEMENLLKDDTHTDLIIQCEDEKFNAHKCILYNRSFFFARVIDEVPDSPIIVVSNIPPNTLRMLLDFIYSGVLNDYDFYDLLLLYEAADSYYVKGLKEECLKSFKGKVNNTNRPLVLDLARKLNDEYLKNSG